jgi:rSAM-associated Gly-rich repeat protein
MNTQMGWTAFLVSLATLCATSAEAAVSPAHVPGPTPVIESRIAHIHSVLKTQSQSSKTPIEMAGGWGNGGGGRGFANAQGGGGWANGAGSRGFVNVNPWRNGWADAGGFLNRSGGFANW